jgi:hypothetical protein
MSIDKIVAELTSVKNYVGQYGWDGHSGESMHKIMVMIVDSDLSDDDRIKIIDVLITEIK